MSDKQDNSNSSRNSSKSSDSSLRRSQREHRGRLPPFDPSDPETHSTDRTVQRSNQSSDQPLVDPTTTTHDQSLFDPIIDNEFPALSSGIPIPLHKRDTPKGKGPSSGDSPKSDSSHGSYSGAVNNKTSPCPIESTTPSKLLTGELPVKSILRPKAKLHVEMMTSPCRKPDPSGLEKTKLKLNTVYPCGQSISKSSRATTTLITAVIAFTLVQLLGVSFSPKSADDDGTMNNKVRVAGQPKVEETQEWLDFNQFVANRIPESDRKDIPSASDWLTGNPSRVSFQRDNNTNNSRLIPKKLFKVNILRDGTIQQVFLRNRTDLELNKTEDRMMFDLQNAHLSWSIKNPGYNIMYFDLIACRKYLQNHFHPIFLRAFDCLEAFSGKTNFFRYLVVFREGGWYSDWKQLCLEDGLLDSLSNDGVTWVAALDAFNAHGRPCQQAAFFGATPQHVVLENAIKRVLHHVQSEYYGSNVLFTTGPCCLGASAQEEGYHDEGNSLARIGKHSFSPNDPSRNNFKYDGKVVVQHKCTNCGLGNDWAKGNNYVKKWKEREYYCEDSSSILLV